MISEIPNFGKMRICWRFACAILLFGAPTLCTGKPPNVIFILADDLGYNDIGYHACHHDSDMQTPFLDDLASKGIKLENYYVQPICTPTRSQLMSGRYQIHTGLQHEIIWPAQPNALPIKSKLLPEKLQECGYDTHMVGKWHLGFYENKFLPYRRGFDTFYGFLTGSEDHYTHEGCDKDQVMCGVDMHVSDANHTGHVNDTWGEYSTHLFTRKAVEAIDRRDVSKPFFLYLAYQAVHSPMQVPDKYLENFTHIKNHTRRIYAGMVAALDESVENITRHLKQNNIYQETIIIFSSDNGGQTMNGGNNWPLRGRKGTLLEGGIKGVGFVSGPPLQKSGLVHEGLMHVSDWYPTLLGVANCSVVNGTHPLDGYNQWGALLNNNKPPRNVILHNIDPLNRVEENDTATQVAENNTFTEIFDTKVRAAVRKGKWKLITGNLGFDKWVKPPESIRCDPGTCKDCNPKTCRSCVAGAYKSCESPVCTHCDTGTGGDCKARNCEDCYADIRKDWSIPDGNHTYLYNIECDPYEKNNLASDFPDVVKKLLILLSEFNSTAVPVQYPDPDPQAYPDRHGGFWVPWM